MSFANQFEQTLHGEDPNKCHVEIVQNILLDFILRIRFHYHGKHIQANENHNCDFKLLIGD